MNNSDITIDSYNKNAEKYEEKFMDFKSYKDKIQIFNEKYIYKYAEILDIGCGPGNNAKIIYEDDQTHKITGLDLSSEMVAIAKKNVPDCEFIVQDIRDIDLDKQYDVVIASFCIVHLTDEETEKLIKSISKILKKNGTLYLSFMEGEKSGLETTSFSDGEIYFNYYDPGKVRKLLSDNLILTVEITKEDYEEEDGSLTKDIFISARKI
ncbi:MAG: class I SAM-dependent methyltransferase [Desulfobacterales bacterium]|nr:class I SAM-dependent methyltransferase [Desulfobacterales bacterium]MCP4159090.1 class I SAM-dependent methyltransferase [Deltaproteobacteria bacterium]